jgi:hypothetical protein
MVECEKCSEPVFENSRCILHIDLPEDENSKEFIRINGLKEGIVKKKIAEKDFNFEGARLLELTIENQHDLPSINLISADIRRNLNIMNCNTKEIFCGSLSVGKDGEEKHGQISFREVNAKDGISLVCANIINDVFFDNVKARDLIFSNAKVGRNVQFRDFEVKSAALFSNSTFNGMFTLDNCDIQGIVGFKDAKFTKPKSKEEACRAAKNAYERQGDKNEADHFFYLEMGAKRLSKPFYFKYPELLVQYCFGYGVKPGRVMITTLIVPLIFSGFFWCGGGLQGENITLQDYIYFNFINALKLGSLEFQPSSGTFQLLATIEAIIGTFLWACFIATFARKFMR